MVDEYWIVLRGPRFKILPWFKKTTYINKYCRFDNALEFYEKIKMDYPDWIIRLGVTRGNDIHLIR